MKFGKFLRCRDDLLECAFLSPTKLLSFFTGAVVYPDIWMLSAESEKLDSRHVPVPAEGKPHLFSPLGLGFLQLGRDTWKKYVQALSPRWWRKPQMCNWLGWWKWGGLLASGCSVRCCSTGYFCPAGSPPCRFLSLSSRSVSLSALAYVKALCCCCRERKWRVDICILNYVSD